MSRYGEFDTTLEDQGRKLEGLPGCARCGKKDLSIAILVIAAGYEVTFCPSCIGYNIESDKEFGKEE